MLADVSGMLANMHLGINELTTRPAKDGRASIFVTVSLNGIEHLNTIIKKLEGIDGVLDIERTGI